MHWVAAMWFSNSVEHTCEGNLQHGEDNFSLNPNYGQMQLLLEEIYKSFLNYPNQNISNQWKWGCMYIYLILGMRVCLSKSIDEVLRYILLGTICPRKVCIKNEKYRLKCWTCHFWAVGAWWHLQVDSRINCGV